MFFGARVILFWYIEVGMVGDHLNRSNCSSVCLYCMAGTYWQRWEVGWLLLRNQNIGEAFCAPQQKNSWRWGEKLLLLQVFLWIVSLSLWLTGPKSILWDEPFAATEQAAFSGTQFSPYCVADGNLDKQCKLQTCTWKIKNISVPNLSLDRRVWRGLLEEVLDIKNSWEPLHFLEESGIQRGIRLKVWVVFCVILRYWLPIPD